MENSTHPSGSVPVDGVKPTKNTSTPPHAEAPHGTQTVSVESPQEEPVQPPAPPVPEAARSARNNPDLLKADSAARRVLLEHHRRMIEDESRVSPSIRIARGAFSVTKKVELKDLGFPPSQQIVPSLVFPIYGVDGELKTYQHRPDTPRINKRGKTVKYETRAGSRMVLDVHPLMRHLLGDINVPAVVGEGIKKGDALASLGILALSLLGVSGYRGTNEFGGKTLLADWQYVALNGRKVYLCFDSDVMEKIEVYRQLATLRDILKAKGADVWVIYLPSGLNGEKVGVDDWLAQDPSRTKDDLFALAQKELKAPPQEVSGEGNKKEDTDELPTHSELRDRFLSAGTQYGFGLGAWRSYEDGIWIEEDELVVKNRVSLVVDDSAAEGVRPTNSIISSVTGMAQMRVAVPDKKWNGDHDILVAQNGVLHIPTETLQPHHPEYYATSAVPYDYDAGAHAEKWEQYIKERFSDDVAAFLQEFAGYCLTTDVSHEIAVWLYGPPGGGRSTFILGMETMLGEKVGVLGLREIERNAFALADVPGKTLLTATEQPGGYTSVTDVINALISGDSVMINQKNVKAYRVHPQAKILWSMNYLPQIPNPDDGLFRRIHVVEMDVIEKKDTSLKDHIKTEGAGILNWALVGLQRLLARGRFDPPEEVKKATADYKATQDVPAVFISDMCATGKDLSEGSSRLYKAYQRWCDLNGHKHKSSTSIASDWKRLGFVNYTSSGVKRYRGVGLRLDAYSELGLDDE